MGAAIIPFPRPAAPPPVLRAAEKPLTYWHCAGDIFHNAGGRGVYLPLQDAFDRRTLFQISAHTLLTEGGGVYAARMFMELTRALDDLDGWLRAVKGKGLDWPAHEVAARLKVCPEIIHDEPTGAA